MGMIMKNGVPYAQGSEIPKGGTKGQVLAKASDLDGDMQWIDEEGGGGGGSVDAYTKAETNALLNAKQNALTTGKGAKIDNNVISFDYVTAGKKAVAYSGPYTKTVSVNLQYKDADYTFTEYIDFGNMGFTSPSDYSLEVIGSIVHNSSSSIIATCLAESEVSRTVWSGTRSSFTVAKENNRIRLYGWFTGPGSGYFQHDFTCSILCKVYCAGEKPTDTTNIIMQTAGTGGICPQTIGVKGSVAEIPMNSTTPITVDISALNIDTDYSRETFVQFDYYSYYNGLRQTVVCEGTGGIFNLPITNSAAGDVVMLEARVNGVEGGKLTDIVFTPLGASQGCSIYRVVWGKYTGGGGGSETLDDVLTNGNEATDKTATFKNSTDNGTLEVDSFSITQRFDDGAGLGNFAQLAGGTLQMGEDNTDVSGTAYIGPKHISLSSTDANGDPLNHFSMEWSDAAAVSMSDDLKAAWKTALDVGGGGTGGGNANFDISTVPLGGAGVYEVNAFLNNNDSERVRAIYSRGVNGELPDWFSMSVTSGLGTDDFHVATKEYADKEVAKKGNAKITFDSDYQYLQIRDDNGTDIGFSQETANTVRVQEYAKDSRGQVQPIFDETLTSKTYVDGAVGDLTTLTTTDKSSAVNAINEIDFAVKGLGEPFRVKQWASNTLNVEIPYCTEDIGNGSIAKMVYSIDAVEGADYQIVGMIAYEVFDAASGGNRINCWPVCQFTGNGQKELSVRWMCAGTTRKAAKRINAWVLLKHR